MRVALWLVLSSGCVVYDNGHYGVGRGPSSDSAHEDTGPILCTDDVDCDGVTDAEDDSDGDGLVDQDEIDLGTDPNAADTDGDGLDDAVEVRLGTDPLSVDSDGDNLEDGAEDELGCDPREADTDGDGLDDGSEVAAGTDCGNPDTDGGGVSDGDENCDPLDPRDDGFVSCPGTADGADTASDAGGDTAAPADDGGVAGQAACGCASGAGRPNVALGLVMGVVVVGVRRRRQTGGRERSTT